MNNPLTVLTTVTPEDGKRHLLTKTFSHDFDGALSVRAYDKAYLFNADVIEITSMDDLHDALTWLETQPHACVVRGEPIGNRFGIRRALHDDKEKGPATLRPAPHGLNWLMLDFDKLPVADLKLTDEAERLAYLISLLPAEFHPATVHYQWSSSAGLDGWETLSCHLWYWLTDPWLCRDLYERFASGDFASCEVDPAPFTVNQVHYTSNPVFIGVNDPLERRSGLIRGDTDTVTLSTWIKPVVPAPVLCNREHYLRFGLSRFDDLLADIGPNYHRPILRAVGHYFAVVDPLEVDVHELRQRIEQAIHEGLPGRSSKADYLDRSYLDRVMSGARAKFGRVL